MPNSPTGRPWPCPGHDYWVSRTFSHKSGSLDNARRVPLSASNDSGRRCLTRARPQGQAANAVASRALTPSARPRPLAFMLFAERTGPAGRLRAAKSMEAKTPHRNGAVTSRRTRSVRRAKGRNEVEQPRGGLTATGRWGRGHIGSRPISPRLRFERGEVCTPRPRVARDHPLSRRVAPPILRRRLIRRRLHVGGQRDVGGGQRVVQLRRSAGAEDGGGDGGIGERPGERKFGERQA